MRVYRGDLDGRPGLVFYAAHATAMTLVYDTARCGLYLAWRGPVLGGLRAAEGGYAPQGPLYHRQDADTLWRVGIGEDTLAMLPRFLGWEEDSAGHLVLRYALDLPGGRILRVEEIPSYYDHYGGIALRREFRFLGLEPGITLRLRLGGEAFGWPEQWGQSANGSLTGAPGEETLVATDDGVSDVELNFLGAVP